MAANDIPQLPAAPFKRYLQETQARYAEQMGLNENRARDGVAPLLSLSTRRMREYLNSHKGDTVPYDTVETVMKTDTREVYGEDVLSTVSPDPARSKHFYCSRCGTELRWKADLCGFCEDEINEVERKAA